MFIVRQQRKTHTRQYQHEAAKMVIETPRPIDRAAEEIGITPELLDR
jgi:hypothetical protein